MHLLPECCRFLLFPFTADEILCLSWPLLCSNVPSLTLWVPVLPRLPRDSPEPIRGSVAPLTLLSPWHIWLAKVRGMQVSGDKAGVQMLVLRGSEAANLIFFRVHLYRHWRHLWVCNPADQNGSVYASGAFYVLLQDSCCCLLTWGYSLSAASGLMLSKIFQRNHYLHTLLTVCTFKEFYNYNI